LTDPGVFAAVIYLFDPPFRTSFYRHRTTGYEKNSDDNQDNYRIALNRNLKKLGPPRGIYKRQQRLFERMHSSSLHSTGLSFILAMSCMRLISMEASLAAMT